MFSHFYFVLVSAAHALENKDTHLQASEASDEFTLLSNLFPK